MRIYVLDEIYYYRRDKQKELGEDFLENQLHFLTKQDAINYGDDFIKASLIGVNVKNVEYVGYEISYCDLKDDCYNELDMYGLLHSFYIEGAEFIDKNVCYVKKIGTNERYKKEDEGEY